MNSMCTPTVVKCFKCREWFNKDTDNAKWCDTCEDWECPSCGYCICSFQHDETQIAVRAMIDTYENYLDRNG